jgi:transcriptional regulator with XRE-family HTH domain
MAKRKLKEKALKLRLQGKSYSQIKETLGVSKSTLSLWLRDHPLSIERINELRGNSPKRIEKFRNTMRRKKETREEEVYQKIAKEIGKLSSREIFVAGLFLYWGEGYKTAPTTTALANTDPAMLKFYVEWLKLLKVPLEKIKVRIHLYQDMDKDEVIKYWKKELGLPGPCFGQAYVKKSKLSGLTYKNGFGRGTCNVLVYNRDLNDYVLAGVKYLRKYVSKN